MKIQFKEGFLKGKSLGNSRLGLEIAHKILAMLEVIELETGLNIEEVKYMKNREDMD
ncbi:hypothetical protein G9F71_000745 [Clostridium sp. FP2]|uniref:hypothetical protein n=1 Tax=Clostridium sp. FP2 TaxID=2724481 RepID=UPI001CCFEC4E|nr:hypothetical protein [Clostridium sp. FP2]MBZ9621419.1 hypothetical protein [Clostridium sp. FP2]